MKQFFFLHVLKIISMLSGYLMKALRIAASVKMSPGGGSESSPSTLYEVGDGVVTAGGSSW